MRAAVALRASSKSLDPVKVHQLKATTSGRRTQTGDCAGRALGHAAWRKPSGVVSTTLFRLALSTGVALRALKDRLRDQLAAVADVRGRSRPGVRRPFAPRFSHATSQVLGEAHARRCLLR